MLAAARFYENGTRNLGSEYLTEVQRLIDLLRKRPFLGRTLIGTLRRMPLRQFPYSLIYSKESDMILVIAVAHDKRRPFYWLGRS